MALTDPAGISDAEDEIRNVARQTVQAHQVPLVPRLLARRDGVPTWQVGHGVENPLFRVR